MKKVVIEVFLLIVLAVVSSIIIYNKFGNTEKVIIDEDENRFKQQYESLNTKKDENGKKYVEVNIPDDNGIVYTNVNEIENLLKNGTGVIYLGGKESNYSRSILEPLFASKDSTGTEKIYYFDITEIRDEKIIENNSIVVKSEGTNDYKKLLKLFEKYLPVYNGLNDDSIKRVYMPTIIFVVDGKITHIETINSDEDENKILTSKEKNEIASIYMKYMSEVSTGVCDEKC